MIKVQSSGLRALRDELASMGQNVTKEVRVAAWKTQKKGRREIAKQIAKIIKKPVKYFQKASYSKMLPDGFFIAIRGEFKMAIKYFKPRHVKAGVVADITRSSVFIDNGRKKRTSGKRVFEGGFMGPRPGVLAPKLRGIAARRKGTNRFPIQALPAIHLTSTLKNVDYFTPKVVSDLRVEFIKQVKERIRFLKVKMAGKLRNQK
jgi:hypothetical protein